MELKNFFRDKLLPVNDKEMTEAIAKNQKKLNKYLQDNKSDKPIKASAYWHNIDKDTIRKKIYENQKHQCCYCGETIQDISAAQLDHIRPKANIDMNINDSDLQDKMDTLVSAENLVCACPACNLHKSSKTGFIDPYSRTPKQDYFKCLYYDEDTKLRIPIIISANTKDELKETEASNHIETFHLNDSNRIAYRMRMLLSNLYIKQHENDNSKK